MVGSAFPHPLGDAHIAPTALLLAEPARAAILWALSDGRALTAGELARIAQVGAPTTSEHLGKLAEGGLLTVARQGRHRYYRLREPASVVAALEALAAVAPPTPARSLRDAYMARGVRLARICYDHLAGRLGVALTDALAAQGALQLEGRGYVVTGVGEQRLERLGIDMAALTHAARQTRRPLARACLDWSERRFHVAGAVGAALASHLIRLAWLERARDNRALKVTNTGRRALRRDFDVTLW